MVATNDVGNADAGETAVAKESRQGSATGIAVASGGCADWWLAAIDLFVRTSPSQGDNVADHIKAQLTERDRSSFACLLCASAFVKGKTSCLSNSTPAF